MEKLTRKKMQYHYDRTLIEASRDPMFTISHDGKITDINRASIEITEVAREDLVGTDFFEYFTDADRARDIYKQIFAEGFVADFPLTIRDSKLTEVLFNGSVYRDNKGKVTGVVVVARDSTDHKRIEKELRAAKILAEKATKSAETAKLKAEEATKIAENAVKSKQQFLSNMSHEIRTPMNAIIGFTKVLLKTDLTFKQREYLSAIKVSGEALTVLINDILDLAKVDAGKMIFDQTPFRIAASISAMIHLFETKIREKNLKLTKKIDDKIPEVLIGDPVRLNQIILNLVSNAVKFTNKGEISVIIRLLHDDEENATVEFSVTDTGIGIRKDKIKHIFENFQQASSETSRLYGGTGLGLAISKQLVESQGGRIDVISRLNKGSTFSFVLSFKKTTAEVISDYLEPVTQGKIGKIKILVVEDIPLNQLLMKTLLSDFGFIPEIAGNGKIAIEKLRKNAYDLILMDLHMPVMNGFEATEHIRSKLKSSIPIIALTADVTTADLKKCKAVGMNDYLSKPIDETLLHRKIENLVKTIPAYQEVYQAPGKSRITDLSYLTEKTKGNQELMLEMIAIYLKQTPPLIRKMNQSVIREDWDSLYGAVHKLIPSFSIIGMHSDFEKMAKTIQKHLEGRKHLKKVREMVKKLAESCNQACVELKKEYDFIKTAAND